MRINCGFKIREQSIRANSYGVKVREQIQRDVASLADFVAIGEGFDRIGKAFDRAIEQIDGALLAEIWLEAETSASGKFERRTWVREI